MINLLPAHEKNALLVEKNHKLVLVLTLIFLAALVAFALVMLSLCFYVFAQAAYHNQALTSAKAKYETADFLEYKGIISRANRELAKVNSFYKKETSFAGALKAISSIEKPAGVRLKNITMEPAKQQQVKVSVFGAADTRENLLAFKSKVEQSPLVAKSYFPPDNWTKPKNINFYFTLEAVPPASQAIDNAKE